MAPRRRDAADAAPISRTRAFYPLTMPLTVGPGSISVAITIGANQPHERALADRQRRWRTSSASSIVALTVFVVLSLRRRDPAQARATTGTSVLLRLSAFILLCIGVQIFWNGASALLAGRSHVCDVIGAVGAGRAARAIIEGLLDRNSRRALVPV